jgi:hypothetical protein
MPITCTPSDDLAVVLITMDYTVEPGVQDTVLIERSIDGGVTYTPLFNYGLLCEQGYYYDTTMPLDTLVTYRGTTNDALVSTCSSTVNSNGFIWFKDPNRPWANIRMDLCSVPTPPATVCDPPEEPIAFIQFGSESRAGDFSLFPYLGAENPGDVYSRRKAPTTSVQFASRTCDAIDRVYDLFTAGGPIMIQAPAVYCWSDRFLQPGDLVMEYISRDQRKPWRLWSVPLAVVNAPSTIIIEGVLGQTWCDVADTYATYADLTASGLTWGDIETVI